MRLDISGPRKGHFHTFGTVSFDADLWKTVVLAVSTSLFVSLSASLIWVAMR